MPARFPPSLRALAGVALAAALVQNAPAQAPNASPSVESSDLDAPLFYQLLIGELELSQGDAGTAFQVLLDAARKTKDEALFKRATDIALQARAGDQALVAANAWRQAAPNSLEAHRYVVQLLVALNRIGEVAEPLGSLIGLTPSDERNVLIVNLPRFFARVIDKKATALVLEQALMPYADKPETRGVSRLTLGRAFIAAQNPVGALDLARRAQAQDPNDDGAVLLALELMPMTPDAESIVLEHLKATPMADGLRIAYASALGSAQRYEDAATQLDIVVANKPTLAPPLLTLGALRLELRQPKKAADALTRYVQLVQAQPPVPPSQARVDDDGPMSPDRGLTRAWLMLAQAAEQQNDYKGAESYLAKVDNPQRALEVQTRRASLLAKQGKLAQARELIAKAPEKGEGDARAKVFAEVQLLREAKQWAAANDVLTSANQKFANDVDLLYEQAMIADKIGRPDEMERLLRRVIELKPDHQHAHNALGYSLAERGVRLPEAKSLIQKALELSPGDPFITDSLGWVEYRMGNRDEAARLLRGAYRQRPDAEIAAHLGEVLWTSGNRDEARRVWREGRNRDSVNDVLRETLARLQVDL